MERSMRSILVLMLAVAAGLVLGGLAQTLYAQSPAVRSTPLLRTDMTGFRGRRVI